MGTFASGVPEGKGTLYDEGGNVIAKGLFENGVPVLQEVVLYDEKGNILYEGTINAEGTYEGEGTLYEEGEPIYEGSFAEGKKEGAGIEFGTEIGRAHV